MIEVTIHKDGKHWLAEASLLDVLTQGRTRADAGRMLADAVSELLEVQGLASRVSVIIGKASVTLTGDPAALIALALRRQRERHGLSLADVAKRLGASSRNAYARYEQGRSVPTVAKLDELFRAIGAGAVLRLAAA
jgi:DNA-binding transcriptional regulator YiaG